jgi:hypothetical protein
MSKAPRLITITVTQQGNTWVVAVDPDPAEVYSDETIVWDVIAPTGVSVEVKNFSLRTFSAPAPFLSGPTPSGHKIKGKLKKGCFAPVYKYEIWIDNTWYIDPDIQIKER